MKKKITFRDACAIWLQRQRENNNLKTSNVNNAIRVSFFAYFVPDDMFYISGQNLNSVWKNFETRWLGTQEELRFAKPYLKLSLLKIARMMNEHNTGKNRLELPAEWNIIYKKKKKS